MKKNKKSLDAAESKNLIEILKRRFEKNKERHKDMDWSAIQAKLESSSNKLWSLNEMEMTGGEPDVVAYDKAKDMYLFFDCSAETPKGRRSTCYDPEAWEARKEHKPENSAIGMAVDMGVTMLTEEQYRYLQTLGEFDLKTSSWLLTPQKIRDLGGAIFGDRRYATVFIYHNGVQSYYAARGFRAALSV